MDFGKLENIIFVAAASAVALFFIIVSLVVISKGKRKRAAGDRLLLAFASIVLVLSALMIACAVFTGLSGDIRIDATAYPALFYFGGESTELPLSEFFVLLSNGIVRDIVIGVFVLAFLTIACDALLTRVKKDKDKSVKKEKKEKKEKKAKPEKTKKQKPAKKQMTPEEAKRMAELERIRRLGDAAVKKASDATKAPTRDVVRSASQKPAEEEEPDWLKAAEAHPHTDQKGFVGLSHIDDNSDFDTFDDVAEEPVDAPAEKAWYEEDDEPAPAFISRTHKDEQTAAPAYEEPVAEEPVAQPDETTEANNYDEPVDTDEQIVDGDDVPAEQENTAYAEEEPEVYADDNGIVDGDDETEADGEPWYAQGSDEIIDGDDTAEEYSDKVEQPEEEMAEQPTGEEDDAWYAQSGDEYKGDDVEDEEAVKSDEPDRDAYIPKIRTIERTQKSAAERAARTAPAKKPAPKKSENSIASKAKPTTKAAPSKKPAQKNGKSKPATERDPKRLPVNRRYVILDKSSAVNIFSDYLKEREKGEKDKLTSSINTIIIK